MERLYVDESGSMTATYCNIHPYFIIAIVRVKNSTKLKRIFKRFISKNLSELIVAGNIFEHECKVEYFDSCNNHIIQIADVFANLMYSELKTNSYTTELSYMKSNNYLKHIFKFPL